MPAFYNLIHLRSDPRQTSLSVVRDQAVNDVHGKPCHRDRRENKKHFEEHNHVNCHLTGEENCSSIEHIASSSCDMSGCRDWHNEAMKQRGRAVRTAVIEATVRKVAELGPQSVTIAAIAVEADVHPTSIYRRWATVDLLVVDALREFTDAGLSIPDTGTLVGDLRTFARRLQDWLATDTGLALARTGVMPTDDAEVLAARAQFWRTRFDAAAVMINRGIERGEVPDSTDPDTVLAAIASPIRLAAISQSTEPRIDIDKLVALVVGVDSRVK